MSWQRQLWILALVSVVLGAGFLVCLHIPKGLYFQLIIFAGGIGYALGDQRGLNHKQKAWERVFGRFSPHEITLEYPEAVEAFRAKIPAAQRWRLD